MGISDGNSGYGKVLGLRESNGSISNSDILGASKVDPGFISNGPIKINEEAEQKDKIERVLNPTRKPFGKSESLVVGDLFFNFATIDGKDFRKIYPYSFTITDIATNTIIKEIFLPLPPSSFVMDIPSATQLTVTLDGIIEESNGAPLRNINISGSTGIVNKSSSIYNKENKPNNSSNAWYKTAADYAIRFGGLNNTVGSVQNISNVTQNAVQRVKKTLGFDSNNFYVLNDEDSKLINVTGFYWFHSLLRFFEYYLHIKKSKIGKSYRLGFNVYKDKQFFFVVLNNFRWQKNQGSLEYTYSISLTAWKKNQSAGTRKSINIGSTPVSSKFNLFDSVRNAISGARQTISSFKNLSYALNQDIYENYVSVLDQINLLVKDLQGQFFSVLDFSSHLDDKSGPLGLADALSAAIKENWDTLGPEINKISSSNYSFSSEASSASPLYSLENKTSGNNQAQKNILPKDLKNNPFKYAKVLEQISISSLNLNEKSLNAINVESQKARQLTVYDLIKYREKVKSFSETFSKVATENKSLSSKHISISSQLNDVILSIDQLINYFKNQPKNSSNDYYNYYIDYAVSNGLNLSKANSKFFVPFPVDATLESLSVQYLGDPGRWIEIAALNGLKSPYIDEEGFIKFLSSNGSQSTILLSNKENLYVGQVLTISSDVETSQKIKITQITEFSKNEFLVSFEDELDLSLYKTIDNAKIKGYLPNTVNSSMLIAIPSQADPINQDQVNLGPGLDQLNSVAQLSKIDFLLTDQGDIALSPNGDIKKASGLTNLSQAAKIKLFTVQGSMLHRPDFGNPLQAGVSIANFNAKQYLIQLSNMFGQDERFTGILISNVNVKGPSVDVNLLIGTSNTGINLPVTTTVPIVNI